MGAGRSDRRQPQTVLLAEDDPFVAMMIEDMLVDLGYRVDGPSASVKDALERIAAKQPDAAILDINLVDGTSFPVADALTRLGVPFLFESADSSHSLPREYQHYTLLSKPIDGNRMKEQLLFLLATASSRLPRTCQNPSDPR